ncbi:MAG: hypothetical protein ACLR0U_18570 [Enterocloster clostridioformis]
MNLAYVPFKVEEDRVGDAVKGAYALNILGMNVTVPHKQRVMEFLSELDEDAKGHRGCQYTWSGQLRAIRAIIWMARALSGPLRKPVSGQKENTVYSLGPEVRPKAAAYVLAKGGAADIHILNRNGKPGPGSWQTVSTH